MARPKRALTQVDGNVPQPHPPSKRQATDSTVGKENVPHDYAKMKKLDLRELLQARNLPYSGNKDVLVCRLEENDEQTSATTGAKETVPKNDVDNNSSAAQDFEFLTFCRPSEDEDLERWATGANRGLGLDKEEEIEDDETKDPDSAKESQPEGADESNTRESICGGKNCICKQPVPDHPECKWLFTRKGYTLAARLQYEIARRNQDMMGQYHYNDYNGYGFQEVMENQLQSFDGEYRKKKPSPAALWSIVEGFAWMLMWQDFWFHIDDPDTVLATLKLLGGAVFSTLNVLEKFGFFHPESPVQNIGLVLGQLYQHTTNWPSGEEEPELTWRKHMMEEAQRKGFEFKEVPFGIENRLMEDGVDGLQSGKSRVNKWKCFKWATQFAAFCRYHRKGLFIGGEHYVLDMNEAQAETHGSWEFSDSDSDLD